MPAANPAPKTRRLAAIMFTDMVGYSSLTDRDESLSLDLVGQQESSIRRTIAAYEGREIKTTGDGFMIEFASVMSAAQCAIEIQSALFERNLTVADEQRFQIRIGLHLGDVLESGDDRFGSAVNLAARVEPLARPGGVALTQQVADQIRGRIEYPLRSLGRARLKNIASPPEVFQLVLPWEPAPPSLSRRLGPLLKIGQTLNLQRLRKDWGGALLGAQFALVLGLLGWIASGIPPRQSSVKPIGDFVDRAPASGAGAETGARLILPDSWKFAKAFSKSQEDWREFRLRQSFEHVDVLQGHYWMNLDFRVDQSFVRPVLLLGLVGDSHLAYLNGQFIGGSQSFADLAHYSFDPSLLRAGEVNSLVLDVRSRPTMTPGIYPIPSYLPFIGEFEEVSRVVDQHERKFKLLQTVYLAVSLLIALSCLGYAALRRSHLKYYYYSLVLFLGSLSVAYYSGYVIATLDYSVYRFTRALAFGWSSFALLSCYLHISGDRRRERANNGVALVFAAFSALALLSAELDPSMFAERYEWVFGAVSAYTIAWLAWVATRGPSAQVSSGDRLMILAYGTVIALIASATVFPQIFTSESHDRIRVLLLSAPFAFALVVLFRGVVEFVLKSREIAHKRRKDDLVWAISSQLLDAKSQQERFEILQRQLMRALHARKAVLYLPEGEGLSARLRAQAMGGLADFERALTPMVRATSGIIGYAVQNRLPFLSRELSTDARFLEHARESGEFPFSRGTCIVLPLLMGNRLTGVIVLAERIDGESFDRDDFALMAMASKDLAGLLSTASLSQAA
jgi:class 3 adenylate cyclase